MDSQRRIQINAPAGNLQSLIAGTQAGADSVYIGFQSVTNLRNLPGLNFSVDEAAEAVDYAHRHGASVHVTVNTLPTDDLLEECFRAVDDADKIGADAVIAADLAVLEYAHKKHPRLELHVSCIAGLTDPSAFRFYQDEFGVKCIVLPRVLSVDEIAVVRQETDLLLEVMVFGVLCANYDGRCCLSSYITGTGAHSAGACAPAEFVRFEETANGDTKLELNGIVINDFVAAGERVYPTPCKGKYRNLLTGRRTHSFQDPCCLNALPLLPKLAAAGVDIVKIEGRQRSPAYVRMVTGLWREAIDSLSGPEAFDIGRYEDKMPASVFEGMTGSTGALGDS